MCRRTEEGLREDECGYIYPLVYASHKSLASAAGGFLYNKYIFIHLFFLRAIIFFFIMWKCFFLCVRLKSVIASDNQENDKSYNASFIQLLISFYIQSEVVSLSVSPSLFKRLSLKLMYHFLFIFYNFLDQQWDLKKTL